MKKIITSLCLIVLMSCNNENKTTETTVEAAPTEEVLNYSIEDVQKGDSASKVLQMIGEPDERMEMPMGITWWKYNGNQIIVISADTVAQVVLDAKQTMQDVNDAMQEAVEEAKSNE